MPKFTDLFIKRPVLAIVISLLIFIIGLRAIATLQVRQFPKLDNTVITVTTSYPGASAQLMEGFITTPLERSIAGAAGIDYLTSTSTKGSSSIEAHIKLNFDPNIAFTNVMSKVSEVEGELPTAAQQPVIEKNTGDTVALMYISFTSTQMTAEQITDYISRVVQPEFETVPGVSQAQILGGNKFAMRIWLNPRRMAALGVTPNNVTTALENNNFQAAAGSTKGEYVAISIDAKTDLQTVQGFKNLVIKTGSNGQIVRLQDIANIKLGSENYNSSVSFNGKKAVFIAISATPTANPLTVISAVRALFPKLKQSYPPSLHSKVVYDATTYIRSSIHEVIRTIIEAAIIVILVIYLFLGSLRTVIIPVVTIPLSLVGVCALMLMLGYSINLLTLLALVLAIGMVVDDAIVVVENIYRHIEDGLSGIEAALQGAREIALPIISMTITLAAVYAPIGFMGGLTGALFKEFAFTLASAVIISGVIALTLSPMMCSKVLRADISNQRFVHYIDQTFERLKGFYERRIHSVLNYKQVTVFFAFFVLLSCMFLYITSRQELAPQEDQGAVFVMGSGPQTATLKYMEAYTNGIDKIYRSIPGEEDSFVVNGFNGVNSVISALIMKPWDKRKATQSEANKLLQEQLDGIPGLQLQSFPLPSLPTGSNGLPFNFVLTTTSSFSQLYNVMEKMVKAAKNSGLFLFIDGNLKFNKPEIELYINRSKAAQLGISMQTIANNLSGILSENYINRFSMEGRSYKVIPLIQQRFRLDPGQLKNIYISTEKGDLIPLATIASIKYVNRPSALTHFQQLNSATLSGLPAFGTTMQQGVDFMQAEAKKLLPRNITYNYSGQTRDLVESGNTLMITFVFSIIVIFLVLAAQFESFRDPLVIMISVPMAICGALLPINWGIFGLTINIYTQIGMITLIGLISKHGILMVEFANKLQLNEGLSPFDAIAKAASIRLRPILMTTGSMVLGVMPLIFASGAGAASRFNIGMTIAFGMTIGTLFTLFVIPTMYLLKTRQILFFLGLIAVVGSLSFTAFHFL